jgi:hypothetical protein
MFDCVYPYGHGFIAATSRKLAGKVSESCARLTVTTLSCDGLAQHFKHAHPEFGEFIQE